MSTDIRIYVADLAAYNNGKLHGVWINATDDLDDIQKQVIQMLAESPEGFAEEYAIHDYEGFEGYALSEYEGLETAQKIACFIEERSGPHFLDKYLRSYFLNNQPAFGSLMDS
ncbi:MAG: antirestriction protein ArdA [Burkholderiales bacterium]|nr:antirestriction protein ArdA [Burkholderiales bacterium]